MLLFNLLSESNSLKLTVTTENDVFVNQAQVTATDIMSDNGVVHVLDAVVLPVQTVVDVAINNNFTSLTAAVAEARLLPALTNPLATYTVFAQQMMHSMLWPLHLELMLQVFLHFQI